MRVLCFAWAFCSEFVLSLHPILFEQLCNFLVLVGNPPLKNALVDLACRDKELIVLTEETVADLVQVLGEAQVVGFTVGVRIVE